MWELEIYLIAVRYSHCSQIFTEENLPTMPPPTSQVEFFPVSSDFLQPVDPEISNFFLEQIFTSGIILWKIRNNSWLSHDVIKNY